MPFNISRQPLVPAFITLFALAAVTAAMLGQHALPSGAAASGSFGIFPASGTEGYVILSPGASIRWFQQAYPIWSRLLAGFLILFAGMCIGRMTVRYHLYGVGSCLSIPLFAIIACGISIGSDYLCGFTAATLTALTVKNYARSFCNGYGFSAIFRASFYLSCMVLVFPAALPLLLLLPLAVILFQRTLREAIVALAGLLLPPFVLCYANWAAGGSFITPAIEASTYFLKGSPLQLILGMKLPEQIMLGVILLLNIFALFIFLSNVYIVGTKARLILIFAICLLPLTTVLLAGPAASPGLLPLLAVPSAIILPVLFIRLHTSITLPLYLILLAAAFAGIILQ